jgi:hypothetical protein
MQPSAARTSVTMTPNPLKNQAFPTREANLSCFFAAQRNTLYGPVLGIDGMSGLKKRNFLLQPL